MSESGQHWEGVYARKAPDAVSWYRAHLEQSLSFVERAGLPRDGALLDVGGGASTFVDDLLERGYTNVTVLDVSGSALELSRRRLGPRAAQVKWLVADITRVELQAATWDFWHDRAVFHFLREPDARARYVAAASRALRPGGHALVATFGPRGPERCSGLEVVRYSADALQAAFGPGFELVGSTSELHVTPSGGEQEFTYCLLRANSRSAP